MLHKYPLKTLLRKILGAALCTFYMLGAVVPSPILVSVVAQEFESMSGAVIQSSGSTIPEEVQSASGVTIEDESMKYDDTPYQGFAAHLMDRVTAIKEEVPMTTSLGLMKHMVLPAEHPKRDIFLGEGIVMPENNSITNVVDTVFKDPLKSYFSVEELRVIDRDVVLPSDGHVLQYDRTIDIADKSYAVFTQYFQGALVEHGGLVVVYNKQTRMVSYITTTFANMLNPADRFDRGVVNSEVEGLIQQDVPQDNIESIAISEIWFPGYDNNNPKWYSAYRAKVSYLDDSLQEFVVSMNDGTILSAVEDVYYQAGGVTLKQRDIFKDQVVALSSQSLLIDGERSSTDEAGFALLPEDAKSVLAVLENDFVQISRDGEVVTSSMLTGTGGVIGEVMVDDNDSTVVSIFALLKTMDAMIRSVVNENAILPVKVEVEETCRSEYHSHSDTVFLGIGADCGSATLDLLYSAAHEYGHHVVQSLGSLLPYKNTEEGALSEAYAEFIGQYLIQKSGYIVEGPEVLLDSLEWSGDNAVDMKYMLQALDALESYTDTDILAESVLGSAILNPRSFGESMLLVLLQQDASRAMLFDAQESLLSVFAPFGIRYSFPELIEDRFADEEDIVTVIPKSTETLDVSTFDMSVLRQKGVVGNTILGAYGFETGGSMWGVDEGVFVGYTNDGDFISKNAAIPGDALLSYATDIFTLKDWNIEGNVQKKGTFYELSDGGKLSYTGEDVKLDDEHSFILGFGENVNHMEYNLGFQYDGESYNIVLSIENGVLYLNDIPQQQILPGTILYVYVYNEMVYVQGKDGVFGYSTLAALSGENQGVSVRQLCTEDCSIAGQVAMMSIGNIPGEFSPMNIISISDSNDLVGFSTSGFAEYSDNDDVIEYRNAREYTLRRELPLSHEENFEFTQRVRFGEGNLSIEIADNTTLYTMRQDGGDLVVSCGQNEYHRSPISGEVTLKLIKDQDSVRLFVDGERVFRGSSSVMCAQSGAYLKYTISGSTAIGEGELEMELPDVAKHRTSTWEDASYVFAMYTENAMYLLDGETLNVLGAYTLPFPSDKVKSLLYTDGILHISYDGGEYMIILSSGEERLITYGQLDTQVDTYNYAQSATFFYGAMQVPVIALPKRDAAEVDLFELHTLTRVGTQAIQGDTFRDIMSVSGGYDVISSDESTQYVERFGEEGMSMDTALLSSNSVVVSTVTNGVLVRDGQELFFVDYVRQHVVRPLATAMEKIEFVPGADEYDLIGQDSFGENGYVLSKGGAITVPFQRLGKDMMLTLSTKSFSGGEVELRGNNGSVLISASAGNVTLRSGEDVKTCALEGTTSGTDIVVEGNSNEYRLLIGECTLTVSIGAIGSLFISARDNSILLSNIEIKHSADYIYGTTGLDFSMRNVERVSPATSAALIELAGGYIATLSYNGESVPSLIEKSEYSIFGENVVAITAGTGRSRYAIFTENSVNLLGTPEENKAPNAPRGIEITDMETGSTIIPTALEKESPLGISAIYDDPNASDVTTQVEIQISEDRSFTAELYYSKVLGIPETNSGERIGVIAYDGDPLNADKTYFLRMRFYDEKGSVGVYSTPVQLAFASYTKSFTISGTKDPYNVPRFEDESALLAQFYDTSRDPWSTGGIQQGYTRQGNIVSNGNTIQGADIIISEELLKLPQEIHGMSTDFSQGASLNLSNGVRISTFDGGVGSIISTLREQEYKEYSLVIEGVEVSQGSGIFEIQDGRKKVMLSVNDRELSLDGISTNASLTSGQHDIMLKKIGVELQLYVDGFQVFTANYTDLPDADSERSLEMTCATGSCDVAMKELRFGATKSTDGPYAIWHDHRGAFPEHIYVIATDKSLQIMDADTYSVWGTVPYDLLPETPGTAKIKETSYANGVIKALLEDETSTVGMLTLDYVNSRVTYQVKEGTYNASFKSDGMVSSFGDRQDGSPYMPDLIATKTLNTGAVRTISGSGTLVISDDTGYGEVERELSALLRDMVITSDGITLFLTEGGLQTMEGRNGQLRDVMSFDAEESYSNVRVYGQPGLKKVIIFGDSGAKLLRLDESMTQVLDVTDIADVANVDEVFDSSFKSSQYLVVLGDKDGEVYTTIIDIEKQETVQRNREQVTRPALLTLRPDIEMYMLASPSGLIVRSDVVLERPTSLKVYSDVLYPEKQMNITWRDQTDNEYGYMIVRSQDSVVDLGSDVIGYVSRDVESFQDTTVVPNTTYYYRVYAVHPGDIASSNTSFAMSGENPERITVCDSGCGNNSLQNALDNLSNTAKEKGAVISLDTDQLDEPIVITNQDIPLLRIEQRNTDKITKLHLTDSSRDAISIDHVDNVVIEGLQITGNMKNAVKASGDNQVFRNNTFGGAADPTLGAGLQIGSSNVTIENNLFYGNTTGISIPNGSDTIAILNNTVDSNSTIGITVGSTAGLIIKNNAITNNGTGIYVHPSSTNVDIGYNYLYGNGVDYSSTLAIGSTDRSSSSFPPSSNPRYAPGFLLQHIALGDSFNSPLIDAGSDSSEVLGYTNFTTRSDGEGDSGIVDIGYHVVALSTAPLSAPAAPRIVQVTQGADTKTQLQITWDDRSSSEDGYKIYRALSSGVTDTNSVEVADLAVDTQSYVDSGLTPGTTYYYQVYAYNAQGSNASPVEGVGATDSEALTLKQVCTTGCQYATIQSAINSIADVGNYEIRIAPGVYSENVVMSAVPATSIRMVSAVPGELVTIEATTTSNSVLQLTNQTNVYLQDLMLRQGIRGISTSNADDVTMRNVYVVDNRDYGLYMTVGSTGWDIENSVFASNGQSSTHSGVYIQGTASSIANFTHNTVSHNYGSGIYMHSGGTIGVMNNNIFSYNGRYGVEVSATGINGITTGNYNNYYRNAIGTKELLSTTLVAPDDSTHEVQYVDNQFNIMSGSAVLQGASDGSAQGRKNVTVTRSDPYPVYVDAFVGDDVTGNGDVNNPYKTIGQGISHPAGGHAQKFHRVIVRSGTYVENVRLENNAELTGEAGASVIMRASTSSLPVLFAGTTATDYFGTKSLKISNLTMTGGRAGVDLANRTVDVSIRDVIFRDNNGNNGGGVYGDGEVAYATIEGNTFVDNYYNGSSGAVFFSGSSARREIVISSNVVSGVHSYGIYVGNADDRNVVMSNNTISGVRRGLSLNVISANDVTIENNTLTDIAGVSGVGYSGITGRNIVGNITVRGNTIDGHAASSTHSGIFMTLSASDKEHIFEDNIIKNATTNSGYYSGIQIDQVVAINNINIIANNNTFANLSCGNRCGIGAYLASTTTSTLVAENNTFSDIGNVAFNNYGGIYAYGMKQVTIRNNTMENMPTSRGIYLQSIASPSEASIVANNTIKGAGYDGILLIDSKNTEITGNTIDSSLYEGIKVQDTSHNVLIEHNKVTNSQLDGITISKSTGAVIRNNLIAHGGSSNTVGMDNSTGNYGITLGEITGSPAVTAVIEQNTIANNYGGIEIINGAVATIFRDNVIAHNGAYGLKGHAASAVTSFTNNTFYNHAQGNTNEFFSLAGNGNEEVDPVFVDAHYNLKDTSPVLNTGTDNIQRGWQDATSSTAAMTMLYVDKSTGNDTTGNGTVGSPYKSIMAAVRNINDPVHSFFSTVVVKNGIYNEQIILDRPVRIQAASGATPSITAVSTSSDMIYSTNTFRNPELTTYNGVHDVFIQGLQLRNGKRGIYLRDAGLDVFVDNMKISNMTYGAVAMDTDHTANFGDLTFTNNTVTTVGTANQEGALYVWTNKNPGLVTISDNSIYDTYHGVAVRGGTNKATEVHRNTISKVRAGNGITVANVGPTSITENTLDDVTSVSSAIYGGISVDGASDDVVLDSNMLSNISTGAATHGGIVVTNASADVMVTNSTLANITALSNNYTSGIFIGGTAATGNTIDVNGNTLTDLTARNVGHGIYVYHPAAVGTQVEIANNTLLRVRASSANQFGVGAIYVVNAAQSNIENNSITEGDNISAISLSGVKAATGNPSLIQNNIIIGGALFGLLMSNTDYVDISDNTFNGGVYDAVGIYPTVSRFLNIQGNEIRNYQRSGLNISSATDVTVVNNLIVQNGSNAYPSTGYGIHMGLYTGAPNPVVTLLQGNTIASNYAGGVYLAGSSVITSMKDNVIAHNGDYGLSRAAGASVTDLSSNSFFQNARGNVDPNFTLGTNGNVVEDPEFVDSEYNLRSSSPVLTTSSTGEKRGYSASTTTATAYTEVYVDADSGNDATADGTSLLPYQTIQAAVNHINVPEKKDFTDIKVRPGLYNISESIIIDHQLRSMDSTDPSRKPVINVTSTSVDGITIAGKYNNVNAQHEGAVGVMLKNITIQGGSRSIYVQGKTSQLVMDSVELSGPSAQQIVLASNSAGIVLRKSLLNDGGNYAITVSGANVWAPVVQENLFENNRYGIDFGNLNYSPVAVVGNSITGTWGGGTTNLITMTRATDGDIRDNKFLDNTALNGAAISCTSCQDTLIKNNLIENPGYGVRVLSAGTSNIVIENNTFIDGSIGVQAENSYTVRYNIFTGGQYALWLYGGDVDYNLYYNQVAGVYNMAYPPTNPNSLYGVNPQFLDPTYNNYRVAGGSQVINAGDVNATVKGLENGYTEELTPDSGLLDLGYHYDAYGLSAPGQQSYPPSNVTIVNDGVTAPASTLKLSWRDNAIGEIGYKVYASTSPMVSLTSGNLVATTATNSTSFTHTGLTSGTPYYYKVVAFMGDGTTFESPEVVGTPLGTVADLERCNPGCTVTSYTTIQGAINAIVDDTNSDYTLRVESGVFTERLTLSNKTTKSLHITAKDTTNLPIIRGLGASYYTFYVTGIPNLEVSHLVLENGDTGLAIDYSSGVYVHDMIVRHNYYRGIYLRYSANDVILDSNRITENGTQGWGGITVYGGSTNPVITNNIVSHNNGSGIQTQGGGPAFTYANISNNQITFNSEYGFRPLSNSTVTSFQYNNVYGNNITNYTIYSDQTGINGNISVDPQYVNSNYDVLESSPILGQGIGGVDIGHTVMGQQSSINEIYVNVNTGSDANGDGSVGSPYKSVQAAIDDSDSMFAAIKVAPGLYSSPDGQSVARVYHSVKIIGDGGVPSLIPGNTTVPGVTISGERFGAVALDMENIDILGGKGGVATDSAVTGVLDVRLSNMHLRNNYTNAGLHLNGSLGDLEIVDTIIEDNIGSGGVYVGANVYGALLVDNSQFYDNTYLGGGVAASAALWLQSGFYKGATLTDNIFRGGHNGIYLANGQDTSVVATNNIIEDISYYAVGFANFNGFYVTNVSDVTFDNNTVRNIAGSTSDRSAGVRFATVTGTSSFDGNTVVGNNGYAAGILLENIGGTYTVNNNTVADNNSNNGYQTNGSAYYGGIHVNNNNATYNGATAEIRNNTITNNHGRRGGIWAYYTRANSMLIDGNTIDQIREDEGYGVINVYGMDPGSQLTVANNSISNVNTVHAARYGYAMRIQEVQGTAGAKHTISNNQITKVDGTTGGRGMYLYTTSHINIEGNKIFDSRLSNVDSYYGIGIENTSTDLSLTNNIIQDAGIGVYSYSPSASFNERIIFTDNIVRQTSSSSLYIDYRNNDWTISNNRFVQGQGRNGTCGNGAISLCRSGTGIEISHNTIANHANAGVTLEGYSGIYATPPSVFEDNIIAYTTGYAIHNKSNVGPMTLGNNNMFYEIGLGLYNAEGTGANQVDTSVATGTLSDADPEFANENYNLLSTSPALGSGTLGENRGWKGATGVASLPVLYVDSNLGNDTTGTGDLGAPYATVNAALDNINGMLLDPYAGSQDWFTIIRLQDGVYDNDNDRSKPVALIDSQVTLELVGNSATLASLNSAVDVISVGGTTSVEDAYGAVKVDINDVDIVGGSTGIAINAVTSMTADSISIEGSGTNGGIYATNTMGPLSISNSSIKNTTPANGYAAIKLTGGGYDVNLDTVEITGNGNGVDLGDLRGGSLTLDNLTLSNNDGSARSGTNSISGVYAENTGAVSMTDSEISNNIGHGGSLASGLYVKNSTGGVTIRDSQVTDNIGQMSGVQLEYPSGAIDISNNTVSRNTRNWSGISIYGTSGPATVSMVGNTLESNEAGLYIANYYHNQYLSTNGGIGILGSNTDITSVLVEGNVSRDHVYQLYRGPLGKGSNCFSSQPACGGTDNTYTTYGGIAVRYASGVLVQNNTIENLGLSGSLGPRAISVRDLSGSTENKNLIENNTITRIGGVNNAGLWPPYAIRGVDTRYTTYSNNIIDIQGEGTSTYGIGLSGEMMESEVNGNIIQDATAEALFLSGSDVSNDIIIRDNQIRNNKGGVSLRSSGVDRILLDNNRITQNSGDSLYVKDAKNVTITHNTIANNKNNGTIAGGISFDGSATVSNVSDNLIAYNGGDGIVGSSSSNIALGDNNTLYSNGGESVNSSGTGPDQIDLSAATGTQLESDPMIANERYDVVIGSPILGTGTAGENRGWKAVGTVAEYTDIYVNSATGNDNTADGTALQPYRTLTAAIENRNGAELDSYLGVQDWYTRLHVTGNFSENLVIDTQLKMVTEGSTPSRIVAANSSDYTVLVGRSEDNAAYLVEIEGMDISGGKGGVYFSEGGKIGVLQNNNIHDNPGIHGGVFIATEGQYTLGNNTIVDNPGSTGGGIYFQADTRAPQIKGNKIENNYRGVYITNAKGRYAEITDNTITRTQNNNGLYLSSAGAPLLESNVITFNAGADGAMTVNSVTDAKIRHNTIANNALSHGVRVNSSPRPVVFNNLVYNNQKGIGVYNSDSALLSNNTIYNSAAENVYLSGATSSNVDMTDNIIHRGLYGVRGATSAGVGIFSHNIIFGHTNQFAGTISDQIGSNNNINVNPDYYNLANFDFRLNQTPINATLSPAVDSGSEMATSKLLDTRITRSDGAVDTGTVDRGYHYKSDPLPPSGLIANRDNVDRLGTVNINWVDESTDNDGYRIYRSSSSTVTQASTLVAIVDGDVTSYKVTGLAPGSVHYFRVYAFYDGGGAEGSNIASATTGSAPVAPQAMYVSGTDAQAGEIRPTDIPFGSTPRFSAVFSDPDIQDGDRAVSYQIQVSTDQTFATVTHWNVNGTLDPILAIGERTPDIVYSGTPLTSGVYYYWRMRFTDDGLAQGAYNQGGAYFKLNSAPTPVTNVRVNTEALGTSTGNALPADVSDFTPVFSGEYQDLDSNDQSEFYELEVAADSGFTNILYQTGKVANPQPIAVGNRSRDISYAGAQLVEGIPYYVRMRLYDNEDAVGAWSTPNTFTILPSSHEVVVPEHKDVVIGGNTGVMLENTWANPTSYQLQIANDAGFTSMVVDYDANNALSGGQEFRVGQLASAGSYAIGSEEQSLAPGKYYLRTRSKASNGTQGPWSSTVEFVVDAPVESVSFPVNVNFTDVGSTDDDILSSTASVNFTTKGTQFGVYAGYDQPLTEPSLNTVIPSWTGVDGFGVSTRWTTDGGATYNYMVGDNEEEWLNNPSALSYVAPGIGIPALMTAVAQGVDPDTDVTYTFEFKFRIAAANYPSGTYTTNLWFTVIPTY